MSLKDFYDYMYGVGRPGVFPTLLQELPMAIESERNRLGETAVGSLMDLLREFGSGRRAGPSFKYSDDYFNQREKSVADEIAGSPPVEVFGGGGSGARVQYAEDYVPSGRTNTDVGYRKNPAFDQQMSLIDARHEALANRNRTIPNEYEYSSEWVDVPVREGVWDSPAPGVEVQRKSGGPVYGTGFDPPQTVPGGSFSAAESTVPGATWTAEDELISKLKDATRPSMGRYRDASGRVQWGYSPEVEAKAREDFINLYNSYKANEAANLRSMSRAGSDQLGVLLDIEDFNRKISNDQFNRENTMYEREFDAYKLDREEKSKLLLARAKNAIDMFNADDMMKADPKMRALINKYISANTLEEQDSIEEEINKYLNAGDETEAPQAVTPRSYIGDVLGR